MVHQSPPETMIDTMNTDVETLTTMATETTESDLVNRMRRLSAGSTESSFSVISDNPSVRSLDTNGSVAGGISVEPPSIKVLEICLEALTDADRVTKSIIEHEDATNTTENTPNITDTAESTPNTTGQSEESNTSCLRTCTPEPSPYWLDFPGFVPAPTATFKDELARLAEHEKWSNKTKQKQLVKALSAEIAHHYGTCKDKLDRWQQLCEDVGTDVVPTSITQCRKSVSPVLVNLYNVIDHRRNPDVKVVRFKSYGQFCRYTRAGQTFPRVCAKQDGVFSAFLRKM